jgi:hypothetical protein
VVPDNVHDFFLGSAGVAGALIGLLFVAISVSAERLSGDGAQVHRIRAAAALAAFLDTLAVSLFALIPGHTIGPTAVAAGGSGIAFVAASLLSLVRLRQVHWSTIRDALFLVGLTVVFVIQTLQGWTCSTSRVTPTRWTRSRSWWSAVSWSGSAGPGS